MSAKCFKFVYIIQKKLAFNTMDLTSLIPSKLRNIFLSNILKLSNLKTGAIYEFELNAKEKHKINSILSETGYTVSELINLPESVLTSMKFSQVLTSQFSNIFRIKIPAVLSRAFSRAHVQTKFAWNFLVSLRTGMYV